MNKVFVSLLAVTLVGGVLLYYLANQGVITVLNMSNQKIDLITVMLNGQMVHEQAYFKHGESFDVKFGSNQIDQIEVKTQMANGAVSRGIVSPGWFADISAQIRPDGIVDFGNTKFSKSTEADGSWAAGAAGGR